MHPSVFRAFDEICLNRGVRGSVLEIGAVPRADSLLCLPSVREARERVGLSLDGPSAYPEAGFEVLAGNANSLPFEGERFDAVLCNSVLEHDPFFWRTLAEVRRVLRPGGLFAVGVPGFTGRSFESAFPTFGRWFRGFARWADGAATGHLQGLAVSCATLAYHGFPRDFYRFTADAVHEVILDGLAEVEVRTLLFPPRIVGAGTLPRR